MRLCPTYFLSAVVLDLVVSVLNLVTHELAVEGVVANQRKVGAQIVKDAPHELALPQRRKRLFTIRS